MSLLNLLLVIWNHCEMEYSLDFLHKSDLPLETREELRSKLEGISRRGFLADWGYAVPIEVPRDDTNPTATDSTASPNANQSPQPSSPLTSIPTDEAQTSPISVDIPSDAASDERAVLVRLLDCDSGSSDNIHYVGLSDLKDNHSITLSMGRESVLDPSRPTIDNNPLYRTVSSSHTLRRRLIYYIRERGLGWPQNLW